MPDRKITVNGVEYTIPDWIDLQKLVAWLEGIIGSITAEGKEGGHKEGENWVLAPENLKAFQQIISSTRPIKGLAVEAPKPTPKPTPKPVPEPIIREITINETKYKIPDWMTREDVRALVEMGEMRLGNLVVKDEAAAARIISLITAPQKPPELEAAMRPPTELAGAAVTQQMRPYVSSMPQKGAPSKEWEGWVSSVYYSTLPNDAIKLLLTSAVSTDPSVENYLSKLSLALGVLPTEKPLPGEPPPSEPGELVRLTEQQLEDLYGKTAFLMTPEELAEEGYRRWTAEEEWAEMLKQARATAHANPGAELEPILNPVDNLYYTVAYNPDTDEDFLFLTENEEEHARFYTSYLDPEEKEALLALPPGAPAPLTPFELAIRSRVNTAGLPPSVADTVLSFASEDAERALFDAQVRRYREGNPVTAEEYSKWAVEYLKGTIPDSWKPDQPSLTSKGWQSIANLVVKEGLEGKQGKLDVAPMMPLISMVSKYKHFYSQSTLTPEEEQEIALGLREPQPVVGYDPSQPFNDAAKGLLIEGITTPSFQQVLERTYKNTLADLQSFEPETRQEITSILPPGIFSPEWGKVFQLPLKQAIPTGMSPFEALTTVRPAPEQYLGNVYENYLAGIFPPAEVQRLKQYSPAAIEDFRASGKWQGGTGLEMQQAFSKYLSGLGGDVFRRLLPPEGTTILGELVGLMPKEQELRRKIPVKVLG